MKKIIYFVFLVQIIGCTSKPDDIKRFDLTTFKKHKQFTKGDTLISLSVMDEFYLEEKRALNDSLVVIRNVYDKYDRSLVGSASMIYNKAAPIYLGVAKKYDSNGNLVKQHDFEKGFTYSVVDLIKKVKSDCNMQIDTIHKTYHIDRDYDNKVYHIKFYKKNDYGDRAPFQIIFNGTTGEYITEGFVPFRCGTE